MRTKGLCTAQTNWVTPRTLPAYATPYRAAVTPRVRTKSIASCTFNAICSLLRPASLSKARLHSWMPYRIAQSRRKEMKTIGLPVGSRGGVSCTVTFIATDVGGRNGSRTLKKVSSVSSRARREIPFLTESVAYEILPRLRAPQDDSVTDFVSIMSSRTFPVIPCTSFRARL